MQFFLSPLHRSKIAGKDLRSSSSCSLAAATVPHVGWRSLQEVLSFHRNVVPSLYSVHHHEMKDRTDKSLQTAVMDTLVFLLPVLLEPKPDTG